MRVTRLLAFVVGVTALLAGPASSQGSKRTGAPVATSAPAVAPAPPLTAEDVNAWLDGFMPYALRSSDIAGAVVVVVKDGKVLTEKGYGWADVKARKSVDPERTLFRPGSTSKLFTWTAVMQLVEQGKLDLDRDVNAYLDFKIPPRDGKPVTLRDLMTHTAGFEETFQDAFVSRPSGLTSLGQYLKAHLPERIYPPHAVPAYSNYGATLAGYIVERVSGEPFDEYVERHIFAPLDMTRSSFRQPLPAALKADMARGYVQASGPAGPYELINVRPAGSLSATGGDMAHFMIAQLQDGQYGAARILQPATAKLMHTATTAYNPPLPAMALGFYHEDRNGHQIIGHAGDTNYFHSDLHLLPNDNVGIFVSVNSLGKAGAAEPLRVALLHEFMDRYFPVAPRLRPAISTQRAHALLLDGGYISSRRWDSDFMRMLSLITPVKVASDAKGVITVSALVNAARASRSTGMRSRRSCGRTTAAKISCRPTSRTARWSTSPPTSCRRRSSSCRRRPGRRRAGSCRCWARRRAPSCSRSSCGRCRRSCAAATVTNSPSRAVRPPPIGRCASRCSSTCWRWRPTAPSSSCSRPGRARRTPPSRRCCGPRRCCAC